MTSSTSTLGFGQGIPLSWYLLETKSKKPEALLCCTPQVPDSAGQTRKQYNSLKNFKINKQKRMLANILVLNVGLWCVLKFLGLAAESSQALEKAQDLEEAVRLPWRQGTSRKLRGKQN